MKSSNLLFYPEFHVVSTRNARFARSCLVDFLVGWDDFVTSLNDLGKDSISQYPIIAKAKVSNGKVYLGIGLIVYLCKTIGKGNPLSINIKYQLRILKKYLRSKN